MHTTLQLSWITQSGVAPFSGCHGSCGIVPNGPASLVISFSIHQGLECKPVASTPTLIMWCDYYALTAPFFEPISFWVYSQRQILRNANSDLSWTQGPLLKISGKILKFLRSLAEYLVALTFLCCHYILDSYITCLTLSFNTVHVYFHLH